MAGTSIFEVKTAGAEGSRFVEAVSGADAFTHVAGEYFKVTPVKAAGLRRLVAEKVDVERTDKAKAALAPPAEPASQTGIVGGEKQS